MASGATSNNNPQTQQVHNPAQVEHDQLNKDEDKDENENDENNFDDEDEDGEEEGEERKGNEEQIMINSMGKSVMTPMRLQNLLVASRPLRLHVPMSTHMLPTELYLRGVRNGTRGIE